MKRSPARRRRVPGSPPLRGAVILLLACSGFSATGSDGPGGGTRSGASALPAGVGLRPAPSSVSVPDGEGEASTDSAAPRDSSVSSSSSSAERSSSPRGMAEADAASDRPAGAPPHEASAQEPLRLTLSEAVLTALAENPAFEIERLRPTARRTEEATARAVFDTELSAGVTVSASRSEEEEHAGGDETDRSDATRASVGVSRLFPTGTTATLEAEQAWSETDPGRRRETSVEAELSQSLLRGFGVPVNLATLRQARLETRISEWELRAAAESLVAEVERTYWDLVLAGRSIAIYEESLAVAESQIAEVRERIRVGQLAETELAASEAELAGRREDLIDARSRLATTRLELVRLLGGGGASGWARAIDPVDAPEVGDPDPGPVAEHIRTALRERADLNEARLRIRRGNLELVRTRNGLLPRLDLFLRLGGSRYAASFDTTGDLDGTDREFAAGLTLSQTLGNRAEAARHERARLSAREAALALANLESLVQVEVRGAVVELERALEQRRATRATGRLREESYRIESEKLRLGRGTALLVAQAWRDLVTARIAEVGAVIEVRTALLELQRVRGTLLQSRGVAVDSLDPR